MESKIRKTLVNVYSLVLSIFVCFIVGVALSKISDKVDRSEEHTSELQSPC